MKRKMWKKVRTIFGLALTVVCLANVAPLEVKAAEQGADVEVLTATVSELPEGYFDDLQNSRAVMTNCKIILGFSSAGMQIEIFTGTTGTVPVVGVKDIKVQQKVWYGWKTVAVCSGAERTDSDGLAMTTIYDEAIKDETYRVTCVHYADLTYDGVENYTEGENDTGAFVFTY